MTTKRGLHALENGFWWSIILILCLAPTQISVIKQPRLGMADLLLMATAAVWGGHILWTRDWARLRAALPPWTHWLLLGCGVLSLAVAAERGETIKELVQWGAYFIIAMTLLRDFWGRQTRASAATSGGGRLFFVLWGVLGAVGALVIGLALVQYLWQPHLAGLSRLFIEPKALAIILDVYGGWDSPLLVGGPFGNCNVLGGFLALLLPLYFAAMLQQDLNRWLRSACAVLFCLGLAITLSGAAYWSIILVCLLLALLKGVRFFIPCLLLFILWQGSVLPRLPRENDLHHFQTLALYDEAGAPTRRYPEWQAAGSMILTQPWLGVGLGNYQRHIGQYYAQVPNATGPCEPDIQNLYLVLGASGGLLTLGAFLSVLIAAMVRAAKSAKFGTLASLMAFALTAIWHPLLVRGIGIPLIFMLSWAHYISGEQRDHGP